MPTFTETWDNVPPGEVLTTNSSVSNINIGAGDTLRVSDFMPSHGNKGVVMEWLGPGAGATRLMWYQVEAARYVFSTYVRINDTVTAFEDIMGIRHSAGNMAVLCIGADGKMMLNNAAGAGVSASRAPNQFPVNRWIRVDMAVQKGTATTNGYLAYAYYEKDSSTPLFSWESAAQNAGTANVSNPFIGRSTGRAEARNIYFGTTRGATQAAGFLAPYVAASVAPEIKLTDLPEAANPGAIVNITASSDDDRDLTYTLTQIAGPTVPLVRNGQTWTYRAPATAGGTALRFRATGAPASGAAGAIEVEHAIRPATEFAVRGGVLVPGFLHIGRLD